MAIVLLQLSQPSHVITTWKLWEEGGQMWSWHSWSLSVLVGHIFRADWLELAPYWVPTTLTVTLEGGRHQSYLTKKINEAQELKSPRSWYFRCLQLFQPRCEPARHLYSQSLKPPLSFPGASGPLCLSSPVTEQKLICREPGTVCVCGLWSSCSPPGWIYTSWARGCL